MSARKRFREPGEGSSASQSQEAARRREEKEEKENRKKTPPTIATPASTPPHKPRVASSQGQASLAPSDSTVLGEAGTGSTPRPKSSVTFSADTTSRTQSHADPGQEKAGEPPGEESQEQPVEAPVKSQCENTPPKEKGHFIIDTRNHLKERGIALKPKSPFSHKLITLYALSPRGNTSSGRYSSKNFQIVHVETADLAKRTAAQQAYVVLDRTNRTHTALPLPSDATSQIVYLKLEPGQHKYVVPFAENVSQETSGSSSRDSPGQRTLPCVSREKSLLATVTPRAATAPVSKRSSSRHTVSFESTGINTVSNFNNKSASVIDINNNRSSSALGAVPKLNGELISTSSVTTAPTPAENMSAYTPGVDIYSTVTQSTLSRTQEKAELQQLNERFAAYVQRVRTLAEKNNQMDSTAIIKSTKVLEHEIHNLKNMYEQELDKLRKELEACNHERTTHQVQVNKQLQYSSELQDRLNVETDKNSKLLDEINEYRRRIGNLEAEVQDLRIAASRPSQEIEQLQRKIDNLTRESETWKHRYEHEEVARLEDENKIQQLVKKMEFNDKVNVERVTELQARIESSAATILSLESKVRELSRADVSVTELLKQVRESADTELRKFQFDTEEQYNRNLTALKAQLDSDAKSIERLESERTQLRGSAGELQARIRSLEGQVANLEHQKQTLEDAVAVERNRAADSVRTLERKLREVQDMLVTKMREVTSAREQNIPLKAEIEVLKALLEEEEKRLRVPLAVTSSAVTEVCATTTLPSSDPTPLLSNAYSTNFPPTPYNSLASGLFHTSTSSAPLATSTVTATPPTSSAQAQGQITATPTGPSVTFGMGDCGVGGRAYVPSPPLSVNYIPEVLQTPGYESAFGMRPPYDDELDPTLFGYIHSMPLAKYSYETTPALNRCTVEPSPPTTPRQASKVRAKSAPVRREQELNLIPTSLGQGHDYFDQMFHDLQRDTLSSKCRPKSSPQKTGRPLSSLYHDYTVSTSSATGDIKIFEVHQDGKYVRVLNDGVQEIEFGGFMLQQNVGGHPVAVFRFPPRTKLAPNTTVTVYAGCNDHKLHNPPTDFVWKEQQKWGTGPECTTILCRPNGQAVAWTTAAHRFTRDAFQDGQSEFDDDATKVEEDKPIDDSCGDDESLTEINVNVNGPKPDPVYLRREKQQPPSLQPNKHPHGNPPSTPVHPGVGQPRPYRSGNDNSSNNRQSRSQSTRPDPIPGQPYAGAAAQKMGSAPLRKYVSGVSTQQQQGVRTTGKAAGIIQGAPCPHLLPLQLTDGYIPPHPYSASGSAWSDGPVVRFTA